MKGEEREGVSKGLLHIIARTASQINQLIINILYYSTLFAMTKGLSFDTLSVIHFIYI